MLSRAFCRTTAPAAAGALGTQARFLNIHEHQSKALLNEFGCKTEFGVVAYNHDEVKAAIDQIADYSTKVVVKSQILAGGRGMGTFKSGFKGGVHVCKDGAAAAETAQKMLGETLVTKQTGEKGMLVNRLFITEAKENIKRELYVAMTLDRKTASPMFIGSAEGGTSIEELAKERPDMIKKMMVNVFDGVQMEACQKFAQELGFTGASVDKAAKQFMSMYNLAKAKDATMVEINPLVELDDGDVMCLDAKLNFDDNAQFRHPEVWKLEDSSQIDPKEVKAAQADLNYIALDGNVGCMVNGAGLAMATMDIISLYGQKPANFLDVGGSAKAEQIIQAFEIITADPNVKCLLVNIFGGIMKCDLIAEGIVEACKVMGDNLKVPLVVRLEGTNEDLGKKILSDSGLKIHPVNNLDEAGKVATQLVANQ